MSLIRAIQTMLHKLALDLHGETLIVAVSGGIDSVTLLHALRGLQSQLGCGLHVATFDHGLRGAASAADAAFVKDLAAQWGLPASLGQADPHDFPNHLNLETAARQARYTFLVQTAVQHGARWIVLGHNRDDQAETVLMHFLRGAGLAGLRGMLPLSRLGEGHLHPDADPELLDALDELRVLRPLLELPRAEIAAYAAEHRLDYREDATNADPTFFRNRLRHEILPLLESFNPNLRERLARTAAALQADYDLLQSMVEEAAESLVDWGETEEGEIVYVDKPAFLALSPAIQRHLLRHLVFELAPDLRDFPFQQVISACDLIARGQAAQQMHLPAELTLMLGYDEFSLHYGGAIPFPRYLPHLKPGQIIPLSTEGEQRINKRLRFYSYWVIEGRSRDLYRPDPLEATLALPTDAELSLRTRRPGDRFCPMGLNGHSQKLSDTFTNLKVPLSLRDRVPLLTVNDQIAWFVAPTASGLQGRIAQPFAVSESSETLLRVRWEILPEG